MKNIKEIKIGDVVEFRSYLHADQQIYTVWRYGKVFDILYDNAEIEYCLTVESDLISAIKSDETKTLLMTSRLGDSVRIPIIYNFIKEMTKI